MAGENDVRIASLEKAVVDLLVPLRAGEALNPQALERFLTVLSEAALAWEGLDFIPKSAVTILIDVCPQLLMAADTHTGTVAIQLNDACARASEAIQGALSGPTTRLP